MAPDEHVALEEFRDKGTQNARKFIDKDAGLVIVSPTANPKDLNFNDSEAETRQQKVENGF